MGQDSDGTTLLQVTLSHASTVENVNAPASQPIGGVTLDAVSTPGFARITALNVPQTVTVGG